MKITDNWIAEKPSRTFTDQNLYGHINGGAELFLEFGFKQLTVQAYTDGSRSIDLELYEMKTAEGALGIYLMKKGNSGSIVEIKARNSLSVYQFLLTSGRYFIQINNFSGDTSLVPIMKSLGLKMISRIYPETNVNILAGISKDNIIQGSELLFCGPYSLQAIYTFGKGDILQLNGEIFGISTDYYSDDGGSFTKLIIPYPSREKVNLVFSDMIEHLDPYLKIIEKAPDFFIFQDYKNKYGLVNISDNILSITINLNTKPVKK